MRLSEVMNNRIRWFFHIFLVSLIFLSGCGKELTEVEYVQRAKDYYDQRNWPSTVIELKNALRTNPDNIEARWLLGKVYLEIGNPVSAEKELNRAVQLGISKQATEYYLAQSYLLQGKYRQILEEFSLDLGTLKEDDVKLLVVHSEAQIALRDFDRGCAQASQALKLNDKYVPVHWALAKCEFNNKNVESALKQINVALSLDDKNDRSWVLLGDIYESQMKKQDAEEAFSKAIELNKINVPALTKRAEVRLDLGRLREADEDIAEVLRISKNNIKANHLKGIVLFKQKAFADASSKFDDVLARAPNYLPAMLWSGLANMSVGQFEQANNKIGQYLNVVPGADEVKVLQAYIQAQLGDVDTTKKTLKAVSGKDYEDPELLALIGQAYLSIGEADNAFIYFSEQVKKAPASIDALMNVAIASAQGGSTSQAIAEFNNVLNMDPENESAQVMLIRLLITEKKYEDALRELEKIKRLKPEQAFSYALEGVVFLMQGNEEPAIKSFNEALKRDKGNPLASHYLAKNAIKNKHLDEAKKYYREVLATRPVHAGALTALVDLETKTGNKQKAIEILQNAYKVDQDAIVPSLLLGREFLSDGNPSRSISTIQRTLAKNPDEPSLLELQGNAYLESGQSSLALETFKHLVYVQPNNANSHYYLAKAYAATNDLNSTRRSLSKALDIDSSHLRAISALAELYLVEGKFNEAMKLGKILASKFPELAEGLHIQAKVYFAERKFAEAEKVLNVATKKFPNVEAVSLELCRVLWVRGKKDDAIKIANSWRDTHTNNNKMTVFLIDAYLNNGNNKLALPLLESLYAKMPKNIYVLNNLSWALYEKDISRALKLADEAMKLAPGSVDVMDTYGWMLLKSGDLAKALEILEKAAGLSKENPTFSYHYASALVANKQQEKAKDVLKKLTERPAFPESARAKKLYKEILQK